MRDVRARRGLRTAVCSLAAAWMAVAAAADHVLSFDGPLLAPDDGFLLGNGGLSCSCHQSADGVVFRFGHNDAWDRRIAYADNPPPATHGEFVRGILDEGWTCRSWTVQDAKATKGAKDEKRFLEICQGSSPALKNHPYPCPKPVGELRLHVPIDLPGVPRWRQCLHIEEGRLTVEAAWANGVRVACEAVIAPDDDVFAVRWETSGWTDRNAPGAGEHRRPPVWCELVRPADTAGLPPPKAFHLDGRRVAVDQDFPPEATFPGGFRVRLEFAAPSAPLGEVKCIREEGFTGAGVRWIPKNWQRTAGEAFVTARTSLDPSFAAPPRPEYAACAAAARNAARAYWTKGTLRIPDDPFLENLWYATGHARRCVLGPRAKLPPGLFFPSTLNDRPIWHGDWHANYNFQAMFWGCLEADRVDELRLYFTGAAHLFAAGRIIAAKYHAMRGATVPLQGFPVKPVDDYAGAVPLGRMAYPAGWIATLYRDYFQVTRDRDWLRREGYPALRDVALFYLDFLKKAPSHDLPPELADGRYHAFPSIEEETRITGTASVLDRPQVLAYIRYALAAAIEAAEELGTDGELCAAWRDRLENLADALQDPTPYARHCRTVCPPEFGPGRPYERPPDWTGGVRCATAKHNFGHSIMYRVRALRTNAFIPGRDYTEYREMLEMRMRPNGLVRAMVAANHGRAGWTESLSCLMPLQEMLLQSWDGAIRLFPYWPPARDVAFAGFRAQGAFRVSSECRGGRIGRTVVVSEKGEPCRVHGTWRVSDAAGRPVATSRDAFGRLCFPTVPGGEYRLDAAVRR